MAVRRHIDGDADNSIRMRRRLSEIEVPVLHIDETPTPPLTPPPYRSHTDLPQTPRTPRIHRHLPVEVRFSLIADTTTDDQFRDRLPTTMTMEQSFIGRLRQFVNAMRDDTYRFWLDDMTSNGDVDASPREIYESACDGLPTKDQDESDILECAVCRCEDVTQKVVTAPCNHEFHNACLRRWIIDSAKQTCPLCRFVIVLNADGNE